MLTIRLSRVGRKNDPSFRVIVVESKRKPQPGNYLEMVGSYNPKTSIVDLKADRIKHWMSMGATISDTVHNLLVTHKIIDAKKINILPAFKAAPVVAAPAEATPAPAAVEEAPAAEEVSTPEEAPAQTEDNSVAEETPAQ
ncbi:MAG: 30S ribosomal protein S16 [Candidatus Adlerbacteria bacterium]|nr:30S ribosomal protein S16 [Candidatus Adlerbacteria bacterium]